jgi:hypothetical protein
MAASSAIIYFTILNYTNVIPRIKELKGYHESFLSLITVCWDLSVMYIIYFISEFGNIPLLYIFCGLMVFIFFPSFLMIIILPIPKIENYLPLKNEDPENNYLINDKNKQFENDEKIQLIKENDENNELIKDKNIQYEIEDDKDENTNKEEEENENEINEENKGFLESLFSIKTFMMYLFLINLMQQQAWYLTSIYEQIFYKSKDRNLAELHNTIFSVMLPSIALLFNFFFGILIRNLKYAYLFLYISTILCFIIRYIGIIEIQYALYVLWIPCRIGSFIFYNSFFSKLFYKNKYLMTLSTIGFSIAGFSSFLLIFWNYITEIHFKGNYLYVNIILDSFSFIVHSIVLIFIIFKKIK